MKQYNFTGLDLAPFVGIASKAERNEKKNADRPLAIIEQRAKSAATKADISFEFFWMQMNYRALVPVLRAMMTSEGLCLGCGHKFLNERDIQIEHLEPPRFETDWARSQNSQPSIGLWIMQPHKGPKAICELARRTRGRAIE